MKGEIQIWGTIISSDNGGSGNIPSIVFDGIFGTFFDSTNNQGGWVGLDFGVGNNAILTSYKLAPRASDSNGFAENRVNGSQIQGCSDPSFSASVVIIDTIPNPATTSNQPSFPMFGRGYYTERFVPTNTSSFRCLRYYASASNSFCNISELRFIASASVFSGSNCQPVTPTLNFAGGLYPNQSSVVSITSRTTSAIIYYTINGTTPTTSSLLYGGPFTLNCSTPVTMSAMAYDNTCATSSSEISLPAYFQGTGFVQGTRFYDNRGIVMNNYSGHIYDNTSVDGKYYWFGMFVDIYQNPANPEPPYTEGVWLYSSYNLYNWTLVGNILGNGVNNEWTFIQRPHVIYNNSTSKYVLWAHAENGAGNANSASIATASVITGPWGWSNDIYNPLGNTGFLDCNLFKDTNNIGYAIYSFGTAGNGPSAGVKIVQLANDYLSMTTASFTHSIGNRESPVMFKYNNLYYVITSQGNFYDSTNTFAVTSSWATSPTGSYTSQSLYKGQAFGDPIGTVYNAQPSFALPINNGVLLGMDFWYSSSLSSSKQVWMPLQFNADNSVSLPVPLPATWSLAQYFQSNVWSNLNSSTI
jgi:hypothetical protein